MEDIQKKEEFLEYLLQTRETRLNRKFKKGIITLNVKGFKTSQSDIWLEIENSPFKPAKKVYQLYEDFLLIFDHLLESVDLDNFFTLLKEKGYEHITKKSLRVQLLSQPIAIMLNGNKHSNISIDLKSVKKSVEENDSSFLDNEVSQCLKLWKDEDREFFFNDVWRILEEINFTDEEIGFAWREVKLS